MWAVVSPELSFVGVDVLSTVSGVVEKSVSCLLVVVFVSSLVIVVVVGFGFGVALVVVVAFVWTVLGVIW